MMFQLSLFNKITNFVCFVSR